MKILGIEICSSSVKLSIIDKIWKKTHLEQCFHLKIENNCSFLQIAKIIKDFLDKQNINVEDYVLTIPDRYGMWRRLYFPFASSDKIKQILGEELDSLLPRDIDSYFYDFSPSWSQHKNKQWILSCSVLQKDIEELVAAFKENNINISNINMYAWGISSLTSHIKQPLSDGVLVLNVRHDCAELILIYKHRLWDIIPLAIDRNLNTYTQTDFLVKNIKSILWAQQSYNPELKWGQILFISDFKFENDLKKDLELQLGIPVDNFFNIEFSVGHKFDTNITSAGLALADFKSKSVCNFIQGNLAQKLDKRWFKYAVTGGLSCFIIILFFIFYFISQIKMEYNILDFESQKISQKYLKLFPDSSSNMRSSQYISILKSKIDRLESLQGMPSALEGNVSFVYLLKQLSASIPRDMDMLIKNMSMDQNGINIRGEADGFKTVNSIQSKIKELNLFKDVNIKGVKSDKDGNQVSFTIYLSLAK